MSEDNKSTQVPSPEMQEMQKMFAEQNKKMEGLMTTVEAQSKTISKLSKALEAKNKPVEEPAKPVIPKETFKVFGKDYRFKVPKFQFGKENITATDALANEKLLTTLVVAKSGVIECLSPEDEEEG